MRDLLKALFPDSIATKVKFYLDVLSLAMSLNCFVRVTYIQEHLDIIMLYSFLSKLMSNCVIDKRREIEEEKSSAVSSLSEKACRMQYKGALFIGHSDKLLFFRTQRKNQYCTNVTLRPSTHLPLYSVISVSVWRVLFALRPAPLLSLRSPQKRSASLCPNHHPQIGPNIQVQSMYFILQDHTRLSA